ncbi:MAG: putative manganese-dependent inorganic diphosphatase [Schaedlerella sp.]|nr:putative manganese-dependent inorganic diphosphatase [Schaedlerella sp.]
MGVRNNKIYVVGHKNPDTDSICSAIAYAELRTELTGLEHSPRRAGVVNSETEFVLDYFDTETPELLEDLRVQVKDVDIKRMDGVRGSVSIKSAWELMEEENINTLPVTRNDNKLEGLITIGDIATSYMNVYSNDILYTSRTQYQNIASTIGGEIICGNGHSYLTPGKVVVATFSKECMEVFVQEGDHVIVGNRRAAMECALKQNAGSMIFCENTVVPEEVLERAKKQQIVIIVTPYDSFAVARLINQALPVHTFMSKEKIIAFRRDEFVDDVKEIMAKHRYRDFPVVDGNHKFLGFISRRRLLNSHKKQVILVDHNEKNQAVDGVEQADVLEIIDHHRLSCIETLGPVYFRNQPVGCTATIVAQMYKENNVKMTRRIAGLLCSAIISDTLMFRSPTCTPGDKRTAKELAKIAEIDIEMMAQAMFRAGSNLKGKTAEEICLLDFKQFEANGITFGIGQVNSMSGDELKEIKKVLIPELEKVRVAQGLNMIFFMLTNILEESSELLCTGPDAKERAIQAFGLEEGSEDLYLPGVVSRKKQMVPTMAMELQR